MADSLFSDDEEDSEPRRPVRSCSAATIQNVRATLAIVAKGEKQDQRAAESEAKQRDQAAKAKNKMGAAIAAGRPPPAKKRKAYVPKAMSDLEGIPVTLYCDNLQLDSEIEHQILTGKYVPKGYKLVDPTHPSAEVHDRYLFEQAYLVPTREADTGAPTHGASNSQEGVASAQGSSPPYADPSAKSQLLAILKRIALDVQELADVIQHTMR